MKQALNYYHYISLSFIVGSLLKDWKSSLYGLFVITVTLIILLGIKTAFCDLIKEQHDSE